jgi:hypothetical protein
VQKVWGESAETGAGKTVHILISIFVVGMDATSITIRAQAFEKLNNPLSRFRP